MGITAGHEARTMKRKAGTGAARTTSGPSPTQSSIQRSWKAPKTGMIRRGCAQTKQNVTQAAAPLQRKDLEQMVKTNNPRPGGEKSGPGS